MQFSPTFWPALALVALGLILLLFAGWVGFVLGIIAIVAGFVVLSRGRGRPRTRRSLAASPRNVMHVADARATSEPDASSMSHSTSPIVRPLLTTRARATIRPERIPA